VHPTTTIGYGRGSRLFSSTSTLQGVGTSAGTAPAQTSASLPPLMFANCRNQRLATNSDLHRPLAACQTYRQRGNSRTSAFSCRCRRRARPFVENARTTDCHAIGHHRQENNYFAIKVHYHHLVPTPMLHLRLRYCAVQRVCKRESEDMKTVLPARSKTAGSWHTSSMHRQSC
jgi:hypothetical protein